MQRWQVAPLRYAEAVCKYWNILHLILYYCSINVCSISKKSNKKENLNSISVLAVVIFPVSLSESLGQVNCAKEKVLCNKEGVGEPSQCWTLVDFVLIFVWMLVDSVDLPNCGEETRRLSFFPRYSLQARTAHVKSVFRATFELLHMVCPMWSHGVSGLRLGRWLEKLSPETYWECAVRLSQKCWVG